MKYFCIIYKRVSEQAGGIVVASDVFEAGSYRINECGVLTLKDTEGENIKSFPPGSWMSVERVIKEPSSVLVP